MQIYRFILFNIILLVVLFLIAYEVHKVYLPKEAAKKRYGVKPSEITVAQYINRGDIPSLKNLLIGLVFGMMFGFMDNLGLWIGLEELQKYMPGGMKTKAAWGNTYSDFLGATLGTFVASIVMDITGFGEDDQGDTPIYINTLGIVIGCILGLFIGQLVTGEH